MAYLHDNVFDDGLQAITDATGKVLHICSSLPTTRAAAISASLGSKSAPTVGAPTDGVSSGRRVIISAITDGEVTADGTASHWALIDGSILWAAEALDAPQVVTDGNPWTLGATSITFPDPA